MAQSLCTTSKVRARVQIQGENFHISAPRPCTTRIVASEHRALVKYIDDFQKHEGNGRKRDHSKISYPKHAKKKQQTSQELETFKKSGMKDMLKLMQFQMMEKFMGDFSKTFKQRSSKKKQDSSDSESEAESRSSGSDSETSNSETDNDDLKNHRVP